MKKFVNLLYKIHKYGAIVGVVCMLLSMLTFAFVQEVMIYKVCLWSFCVAFISILGLGTVFQEMSEEDF